MYIKVKNHERTAFYQQKYIQLKDSVYSEELTINLMKIEADYQERENRAKIEAQGQVLQLKEEIIKRQQILNIVVSFSILVLIAFTIVLWRNFTSETACSIEAFRSASSFINVS